jgi:hypothetical protein
VNAAGLEPLAVNVVVRDVHVRGAEMVLAGIEQDNADPRLLRQRQMLSKLSKSGFDASRCDAIGHWVKPCVIVVEKAQLVRPRHHSLPPELRVFRSG